MSKLAILTPLRIFLYDTIHTLFLNKKISVLKTGFALCALAQISRLLPHTTRFLLRNQIILLAVSSMLWPPPAFAYREAFLPFHAKTDTLLPLITTIMS